MIFCVRAGELHFMALTEKNLYFMLERIGCVWEMSKSSIINEKAFYEWLITQYFPPSLREKIIVEKRGHSVQFVLKEGASLQDAIIFGIYGKKKNLELAPGENAFYLPTYAFAAAKQVYLQEGV